MRVAVDTLCAVCLEVAPHLCRAEVACGRHEVILWHDIFMHELHGVSIDEHHVTIDNWGIEKYMRYPKREVSEDPGLSASRVVIMFAAGDKAARC